MQSWRAGLASATRCQLTLVFAGSGRRGASARARAWDPGKLGKAPNARSVVGQVQLLGAGS